MTIVEQLWREGWFERNAKYFAGRAYGRMDWQDIAHEAVIVAMRAENTYDPEKVVSPMSDGNPPIVRWVKMRARGAMIDVFKASARKRAWERESLYAADQPVSRNRDHPGTTPLMDLYVSYPSAEDCAQLVDWGEVSIQVRQAIELLTDKQRDYILAKYYDSGKPCNAHKAPAMYALRMKLWHLKTLVR